jgi:hypothetical protein
VVLQSVLLAFSLLGTLWAPVSRFCTVFTPVSQTVTCCPLMDVKPRAPGPELNYFLSERTGVQFQASGMGVYMSSEL